MPRELIVGDVVCDICSFPDYVAIPSEMTTESIAEIRQRCSEPLEG